MPKNLNEIVHSWIWLLDSVPASSILCNRRGGRWSSVE